MLTAFLWDGMKRNGLPCEADHFPAFSCENAPKDSRGASARVRSIWRDTGNWAVGGAIARKAVTPRHERVISVHVIIGRSDPQLARFGSEGWPAPSATRSMSSDPFHRDSPSWTVSCHVISCHLGEAHVRTARRVRTECSDRAHRVQKRTCVRALSHVPGRGIPSYCEQGSQGAVSPCLFPERGEGSSWMVRESEWATTLCASRTEVT